MNYKNGKDVLPPELLKWLQDYVQGELVYIPKKEENRVGWGQSNGTRMLIEVRNGEIRKMYMSGTTVDCLMEQFHLSEDSIRKIVSRSSSRISNG